MFSPTLKKNSNIFILGEALLRDEAGLGIPFISTGGAELKKMLSEAGIDFNSCSSSVVLSVPPAENKVDNVCVKKAEAGYSYPPPLSQGKYLHPSLLSERNRVYDEINLVNPNLVIALGNVATWCLLDKAGIASLRGATFRSPHVSAKVLPTYHPAAILRNWELRHTVVVDLMKAEREQTTKDITYDEVTVIIEPTFAEMEEFLVLAMAAPEITIDIETSPLRGQITCVGFSTGSISLVIPFVDKRKKGYSYWPTQGEEVRAWSYVKRLCSLPNCKILQNGMYDITWLWRKIGITLQGSLDDTMLFHHSMFPEMTKGLDFLGSIYANLPAWKTLHRRGEYNKAEE